MIVDIILEYLQQLVIIIGSIEMIKKYYGKKISKKTKLILQLVLSFIVSLISVLIEWSADFSPGLVFTIGYRFLLLVILANLFYDTIVKKIKLAGKNNGEK